MKDTFQKLVFSIGFILIISCVKTENFDAPGNDCNDNKEANKTVRYVFNNASSNASKYTSDDIIEGYVISSDQAGNFFKEIYLQSLVDSIGFKTFVDLANSYTVYNPGRKIYVELKNTYTEIDNYTLEIGDLFIDNFSNETVGRLAYPTYENILLKSCTVISEDQLVRKISINNIADSYLNKLVEFDWVQFADEALGTTLYDSSNDEGGSATNHYLEDSSGNTLIFRTSAFADFAAFKVPEKSGTIRGILTKFKGSYQLIVRTVTDVQLTNDRFEIELKNNLFFSELADPNNNNRARFIEIYNAEDVAVNLNGWSIRRYTNSSTSTSSTLDLTGVVIESNQALVIAANASEFEAVFGFQPDLEAGTNGPADSNGDDNLELVDSQGQIVDVFGIIGEDGSGTNHEFEDGRALRKAEINKGNVTYTFNEWLLWNDTGNAGTIKEPQDAPGSYTPGVR